MAAEIRTVEGLTAPTYEDIQFMDYLDELSEVPTGHSFGLLLFKADPTAFRIGRDEFISQEIEETP